MLKAIQVGSRVVGDGQPCFIVAEIGMNHDGDKMKAKELIAVASEAGVDAVKFQTFRATDIINPRLPADYDPQEPVPAKYQFFYEYLEHYELPYEWHDELIEFCRQKGILFISTPCSVEAVRFLSSRVPAYKIASMDLTNRELLTEIGKQGKPIVLSTGIGTLGEIERATATIKENGAPEIALLHCVSNYPAKPEELNLHNISMLKQAFDVPVGFSDHSLGIVSSIAAVTLGACIIEKHITLDRSTPGPDHYFALEPDELKALVRGIREVQAALGQSIRHLSVDETPKRNTYRRSLVACHELKAGHRLQQGDVIAIRPGAGIDPFDILKVEGLTLKTDVPAFTPLQWDHFK